MKKIVALILTLVMALSLFAGCVNNNAALQGNFVIPEGGYDGSPVTIKFYHTMGANLSSVLNIYIEEFNKLYPNITVVSQNVGNYDDCRDQISTEITVGNQPNIASCYPDQDRKSVV